MLRPSTTIRPRDLRGIILGIICVVLVGFSATVQVAHGHDLTGAAHSDCSLCMIVHAGIAPHAPAVIPAPIEHTPDFKIHHTESPRDSFVFSFYTRPPPAEPAFL